MTSLRFHTMLFTRDKPVCLPVQSTYVPFGCSVADDHPR